MVDREARDKLAALLRQYLGGEINANDLLSQAPVSNDAAVVGITQGYKDLLIGGGHFHPEMKLGALRIQQLPKPAPVAESMERAVLFLQTDLDYQWREYSLLSDPTLSPFQLIAFLLTFPFMMLGLLYASDLVGGRGWTFIEYSLIVLMIISEIAALLFLGGRLRSLFTGIDRRVWPFYRRQQYRNARGQTGDPRSW